MPSEENVLKLGKKINRPISPTSIQLTGSQFTSLISIGETGFTDYYFLSSKQYFSLIVYIVNPKYIIYILLVCAFLASFNCVWTDYCQFVTSASFNRERTFEHNLRRGNILRMTIYPLCKFTNEKLFYCNPITL